MVISMGKNIQTKREREKNLVSQMIILYCRKQHHTGRSLCVECAELEAYARERSDKCPFMETKSFCSNCKVSLENKTAVIFYEQPINQ